MPTGKLPKEPAALWERVYKETLAGDTHKGDKGYAAKVAWTVIHNQGWEERPDGEWTTGKSDVVQEFSMIVTKAVKDPETGKFHVTLSASDTERDLSLERTSKHLFDEFVSRIDNKTPIPEAFKSVLEDGWNGGMPYLSIAHYKSMGGKAVPGEVNTVFIDGDVLKSKATLNDAPLGRAVAKSLVLDAKGASDYNDPVRVSIGFLDLGHRHGDFLFERKSLADKCPICKKGQTTDKEYWSGILVHEAFTRKPMNPRTGVDLEQKSMDDIVTKRQDAESIIGVNIADELEMKSKAEEDLLVQRAKNESMDMLNHVNNVHSQFHNEFNTHQEEPQDYYDLQAIHKDHVIARKSSDGKLYQVNYSKKGDGTLGFQAPGEWTEVEHTHKYVPVGDSTDKSQLGDDALWREDAVKYLVHDNDGNGHLPYTDASGKISTRLLGAAHAALTKTFRGHAYAGPNKAEALSKLNKLRQSAGLGDTEKSITAQEFVPYFESFVEEGIMAKLTTKAKGEAYPREETDTPPAFGTAEADLEAGLTDPKLKKIAKKFGKDDPEEEFQEVETEDKPEALLKSEVALNRAIMVAKSRGLQGKDAEKYLQPYLTKMAAEISGEVIGEPDQTEVIRSLANTVHELAAEVKELRSERAVEVAKSLPQRTVDGIPMPRSFSLITRSVKSQSGEEDLQQEAEKNMSQIQKMARRSTVGTLKK